ncbi:Uncharacterized protein FWK35_00011774 [Aphis craccivora]|uniref:Uncharacterized protein n=1 Tax=Aphis craccivora TaxID=307492 RepID=A0A6G0Y7N0_APHCR|nr:Uncharacterized protein FWK35_00011774 [Aphis craccivora]
MSQKSSREGCALRNSSQSDKSTASMTNSDLSGRTVIIRPSSSSFREKHEIKNSNNLVTYNDRGDLEAKNSKLSQELHPFEKVSTQEVSNSLHDPYDLHHIHGLRNRLFKTFNEFSTILKNALLPPVLKSAKKVKIKIKECDLQSNNILLDLNLLLSEIKIESKNKNLHNKKNKTNVTLRKFFQIKLIKCYKLAINATTICTKTLEAGIYNPIQSKMKNLIQIISALSLIAGKYLYGEIYKKKKKESFDLVEHCKDLEIMLEECDYKDTDDDNHSNISNSNVINELFNKALSKPKTQLFSANNSNRLSMYNHDKPKLGSNYAQAWSKKSIETTRNKVLLKNDDSNIKNENNLDNIKTVIQEYPFGELNENNYPLFFKELQDEKLINNEAIECPTTSKILNSSISYIFV